MPSQAQTKLSRYRQASLFILYSVESSSLYAARICLTTSTQWSCFHPLESHEVVLFILPLWLIWWHLEFPKVWDGRNLVAHTVQYSHCSWWTWSSEKVGDLKNSRQHLAVKLRPEPKSPLMYNILPESVFPRNEQLPLLISHSPDDSSLNLLPIDSTQVLKISSSAGESSVVSRLSSAWGKGKGKGEQTGIGSRAVSSSQPGCCSPPLSVGLNSIPIALLPWQGSQGAAFRGPFWPVC